MHIAHLPLSSAGIEFIREQFTGKQTRLKFKKAYDFCLTKNCVALSVTLTAQYKQHQGHGFNSKRMHELAY